MTASILVEQFLEDPVPIYGKVFYMFFASESKIKPDSAISTQSEAASKSTSNDAGEGMERESSCSLWNAN